MTWPDGNRACAGVACDAVELQDYVFASVTKAGSSSTRTASPVARYTLRRCESGDAGELALLDVSSLKDAHPDWANADALKFSYQPPPTQQPAGRDGKGR